MGLLEKFRRIMQSDPNYSKRDEAGLARGFLWEGVYDRSNTPKDGWGGIPANHAEESHPPEKK